MRRMVFLLALTLLPGASLAGQVERQTGYMVHQLCVVPPEKMAEYNRLQERILPILEALQEEGMIRAWFDLRHSWGDEWNVGFVSIADSRRAWFDYWQEFIRRVNEAEPGWFAEITVMCTMHKDNLYGIRDSRGGGR